MSLNTRLDFEEGKISGSELFAETCCNCKYWFNLISRRLNYCHKCINNTRVPVKRQFGFSIEELYDYFSISNKKIQLW